MVLTWFSKLNERYTHALGKTATWIAMTKFALPFTFGAALVGVHLLFGAEHYEKIYPLMAAHFLPPLGKESIIPIAIVSGLNPMGVALTVAGMDSIVALFVIWNFDLICKTPIFGSILKKAMERANRTIEKHPFTGHLAYAFLFFFVLIPFQGSGGVTAAIIGRLLALNTLLVWAVITIAAIAGSIILAYSSKLALLTFI